MRFVKLSENDGIAHFLNSSLNKGEISKVKNDVSNGITKLLYVAPESLTKKENIEFLTNITISFLLLMRHIVFQSGDMILDLNIEGSNQ